MKPKDSTERTVNNVFVDDSPQQQYSMKATAKAFRILSSSLCTDRIGSMIREISSNAHDAHVDNSMADVPFDVVLSTISTPTFSRPTERKQ